MANLSYADAVRNDKMDAVTAAIGSNGLLRIYDGTQPADADTAISGPTLLAELALSATAAAGASGGVLTFSSISDDTSANATGTASWFAVVTSGGTRIVDGDVSTVAAGTGDLQLDSTSIVAGQTVSVSSFTITEGSLDA